MGSFCKSPGGCTPAELGKFVRQETADAARPLKAAGIKPQ